MRLIPKVVDLVFTFSISNHIQIDTKSDYNTTITSDMTGSTYNINISVLQMREIEVNPFKERTKSIRQWLYIKCYNVKDLDIYDARQTLMKYWRNELSLNIHSVNGAGYFCKFNKEKELLADAITMIKSDDSELQALGYALFKGQGYSKAQTKSIIKLYDR